MKRIHVHADHQRKITELLVSLLNFFLKKQQNICNVTLNETYCVPTTLQN